MKIANTFPFKAILAAASITTIGVIALNILDTEVVDYGVPVPIAIDQFDGCRLPMANPPPPIEPQVEPVQPFPVTST